MGEKVPMKRFVVVDFLSVGPRANRFPSSQEHENPSVNLFTRIFELLVRDQYAEAQEVLDLELLADPLSGEAILAWTELMICQGQLDAAWERVESLRGDYPRNPYYFLSQVLLELEDWRVDPNFQAHIQMDYDDYVESVAAYGAGSSDLFAKIALVSSRRGMWKTAMTYFVEAIKAKSSDPSLLGALLFLWDQNSSELESYLVRLPMLDELEPMYEEMELTVKTVCLLLIAYEDLGICEAWPVAIGLANGSKKVAMSWGDLAALFEKWCPRWVVIERNGGAPLVRARLF